MQIGELEQLFALHPEVNVLAKELSKKCEKHFLLRNLFASSQSLLLHAVHQQLLAAKQYRPILVVLDNADDAQYMYADLRTLSGDQGVYFFPSSHRRQQKTDEAMLVQRTEVLSALVAGKGRSNELMGNGYRVIIVTYPEALAESVPHPNTLQQQTISLHTEQEIAQSAVIKQLLELHFQRVDFVYEPGQFAVRGGIVDI